MGKNLARCLCALGLLLAAGMMPAAAEGQEAAAADGVRAYKVQLHDTLDREGFIAAYNEANAAAPMTGMSEPRTNGDYVSTVSPIGAAEAVYINTNGEGRIANIILMHKGQVTAAQAGEVFAIYAGLLDALGYGAVPNHEVKYEQSFRELGITSPEAAASRFTREDNGRIYTFYKSYNPQSDVCMILIEAIVEK